MFTNLNSVNEFSNFLTAYTKSIPKNMPEFGAVRFYSENLSKLEVPISKNHLYTYAHANPCLFNVYFCLWNSSEKKKCMKLD